MATIGGLYIDYESFSLGECADTMHFLRERTLASPHPALEAIDWNRIDHAMLLPGTPQIMK
jgi:hypothetical protein